MLNSHTVKALSKRTLLSAALAAAFPIVAFAQTGGSMSSSHMDSSPNSRPMMTSGPHTTGSQPTTGSTGKPGGSPWIKSIQAALNRKEHAHLAVDGKMGKETRTALKKFQKSHGLKPTGTPNKATQHALGM